MWVFWALGYGRVAPSLRESERLSTYSLSMPASMSRPRRRPHRGRGEVGGGERVVLVRGVRVRGVGGGGVGRVE